MSILRMIAMFVLVLLVALGAAWLADQPGGLVLSGGGYEVTLSPLAAGVALVLFAITTIFVWRSYHWITGMPAGFGALIRERGRKRGFHALSHGLIAAGTGDVQTARREAALAQKQLGTTPLTLLLNAQTAQLAGDEEAARAQFDAMLQDPETEALGLRGLFVQARKSGDAAGARALAERAFSGKPETDWAGLALFELQAASGDWTSALRTLESRRHHKQVDKAQANRLTAVIATARAQELEADEENDAALEQARQAHKLAPDLVPAAETAARLLASRGDFGRAARIIETTWKKSPHPDLASLCAHLRPGDAPRDRLKRVTDLAAKMPGEPDGALAVARAALEARLFDDARSALQPLLDNDPSQRVCALMAEIESAERGDRGRVREWLARAVNAPRDPRWVADGHVSETWKPVSPQTGALDAFVWKVPVDGPALLLAGTLETHDEELDDGEAGGPLLNAAPIVSVKPVTLASSAEPKTVLPEPTDGAAARDPTPAAPESEPVGTPAATITEGNGPAPADPADETLDPAQWQPDDPGPVTDDDIEEARPSDQPLPPDRLAQ